MPGSTTERASCRSGGPSAGSCSCTAAASCRSRSFGGQCAGRAGAGRALRRRHLRAPFPRDQRARGTGRQGEGFRRLSQAARRELRRPRAQRAPQPHRARAGCRSPPPRRARRDGAGRAVAAPGGARPGRVSVRAVGSLRRGVPVAARGSADDDDDSPSALLSGAERPGRLLPVFLAVLNTEPEKPELVVAQPRAGADGAACGTRGSSGTRIGSSRSRDSSIGSRPCCSTRRWAAIARRPSGSAGSRRGCAPRCSARPELAGAASEAGLLCKADLATDMVRELTELQGTIGGIYAREDGRPGRGLEGRLLSLPAARCRGRRAAHARAAGHRRRHLGRGVAGRQARHARRDVLGRRAADRLARSVRTAPGAQGLVRTLLDLPELTGLDRGPRLGRSLDEAARAFAAHAGEWRGRARRVPAGPRALRARAARLGRAQRARGDPRRASRSCRRCPRGACSPCCRSSPRPTTSGPSRSCSSACATSPGRCRTRSSIGCCPRPAPWSRA